MRILLFSVVLGFICTVADSQSVSPAPSTIPNANTPENACPGYCSMKPDSGTRGKTPFRRWHFDWESKECKRFSYGGRGGNRNRFMSKEMCESKCANCNFETDKTDICSLPKDTGRCDSAGVVPLLSWYFDSETDLCQPFAYSGCGGNENKFDSQAKCQEICDV